MDKQLTVEKVIEHHLSQNTGQKITPHLIAGLAILMGQNIRSLNNLPAAPRPTPEGVSHD